MKLLALMVPLSVFTTDMYLSSFEELGYFFGATPFELQLTLSGYFIFLSVATLLCALFCEMIGCKKSLLLGLGFYLAGTLLCLATSCIAPFIAGRFLQAIGGSATSVIPRILAKEHKEISSILALMLFFMSVALLIAPLLGGIIQTHFGWRGNFFFLAALAILYFLAALFFIPERKSRTVSFLSELKSPVYFYFTMISVLLWAGFLTFVSAAPFILLTHFHCNPFQFGLLYAIAMMGFVSGTWISRRLFYKKGLFLCCFAALFLPFCSSLPFFIALTFLYLMGTAILLPIAQAKAVEGLKSGTYSFGIMYFLMMLCGGITGLLVHQFGEVFQTATIFMSLFGAGHLLLYLKIISNTKYFSFFGK